MSGSIIAALILAAVAALFFLFGFLVRKKRLVFIDTPTLTAAQLAEATFRAGEVVAEVSGRTGAGPAGPLSGPYSEIPCVWYETTVVRHYRKTETDSKGNARLVNATETVETNESHQVLTIKDATGRVLFEPVKGSVDGASQTHERYEQAGRRDRRYGHRQGTTGFTYRERALKPDVAVFAIGRVRAQDSTLVMGKPENGPFMVSTRSEAEHLKSGWFWQRFWFGGSLTAVAVAMGLIVYDLL
ncbi:GIDE domain-containing protein [Nocardiopsis ansamitocini]|uniref:RING-type E3 ubiquitin transferase n=1 Tax=Nocardiopsis ansamitocini TaxID=1670832 RepID=A0A9W6P910_9ACTN|nr:GIDE domain-containing protein [Nocardiopsis ansamitocini]GLU49207.1 hypothetical protein Nans01_35580 [Nocardiopsis ansamitocini]